MIGDVAALFVRNADRRAEPFSVPLAGEGEYTVYLAGVAAGNWSVTLDGVAVASATAAEEGGLLVFRAPAGDLSLSRVG